MVALSRQARGEATDERAPPSLLGQPVHRGLHRAVHPPVAVLDVGVVVGRVLARAVEADRLEDLDQDFVGSGR